MSSLQKDDAMATNAHQPDTKALVLSNLGKSFKHAQALTNVSFSVRRGELFGVLGPDGAGKTTLFNIISGIMSASAGSINIASDRKHPRIGYVTQQSSTVDELTVMENTVYSAMLANIDRIAAVAAGTSLLKQMDLLQFKDRLAGQLSGGMKQKLALCCALIIQPDLLLLDEPSTGLDPIARRDLWQRFVGITQTGVSMLVATPDFDEAEMCDRVVFLHNGAIMKCDTPANLRDGASIARMIVRGANLDRLDELLRGLQDNKSPILDVVRFGNHIDVLTKQGLDPQWLSTTLSSAGFSEASVESSYPSLENAYSMLTAGTMDPPAAIVSGSPISALQGDMIQVQDVSKSFGGFRAIKNLSLSIEQAEVFGLLGANGAGKTTTLRLLCGLLEPTNGQIVVSGMSPHEHSKRLRSLIGYVNQQFSLYDDLTVEENIAYTARAFRLSKGVLRDNVNWAIKALDLDAVRTSPARRLSRGVKQRVALAAAISHKPLALLLDEPTAGTDPEARRRIWRLIRTLTQEGTTVLVTTHHLEEAEFCNRIGLLVDGTLIASGTPDNIKRTTGGSVLEVRSPDLQAAVELVGQVIEPRHILRLPDKLRILFDDHDGDLQTALRSKLAGTNGHMIQSADLTLEEAFILRCEQTRGRAVA